MATSPMSEVVQHLRRAVLSRDGAGLTDGQLLEDYIGRRDEAALAALVQRHGPMVWSVCRRVLRHEQDAEDAFQATFLVLVRKAGSIASPELLANWLYGVAYQTALNARTTAARRSTRERQVTQMPEPAVVQQDLCEDLQPLLDLELSRLPEKYRMTIVLCDLEGKTRKEVAEQLDCPEGTVAGRLARARVLLARRLARHGLVGSGGALAAAFAQGVATAAVPSLLVGSTVRAALSFAAGTAATQEVISARVAALAEGVVKAMLLTKLKMAARVMVTVLIGVLCVLAPTARTTGQPQKPAVQDDGKRDEAVNWKERHAIEAPRGTHIFSASISPDGKVVAFGTNKELKLWDATTGKQLVFVDPDFVRTTAISPNGKVLATGHINAIKLWDAATGKALVTLADDTKNIAKVVFAPDGKLLATAEVGVLRVWDLATNKELRRFESDKLEGRLVYGAAFSPDGKTLASAEGPARKVKLWEVATGKELKALVGHTQRVLDVAFSPDGRTLASAGGDGQVKLWDVGTGKERTVLNCQTSGHHALAFSPDGKLLATSGGDSNNVKLWDAKTGKELVTLNHKARVWSVAFSRDGKTLVTAGDDAVRIWRAEKK